MARPFSQTMKKFIRNAGVEKLAWIVFMPLLRNYPVESWPGFIGRLCQLKVPKGVRPNPVRSPVGAVNIKIVLTLLQSVQHLAGDVAECGVFRGATVIPMGQWLNDVGSKKMVWGFDSFQGFDDSVAADIELGGDVDPQKMVGGFSLTSLQEVQEKVDRLQLTGRIHLVKGTFKDTLPKYQHQYFSFVHLDCDLYESYKVCLDFFYPRVVPGGIILFDEYNDPPWPGCNKAVDEFLTDKPEKPVEIEMDNYIKYYIKVSEKHIPACS